MIRLTDILNEAVFYGKAKVLLQSKAKDAELPSQLVEFNFNYSVKGFSEGPTLYCIPKSSKDLDKIDTLGSISKMISVNN